MRFALTRDGRSSALMRSHAMVMNRRSPTGIAFASSLLHGASASCRSPCGHAVRAVLQDIWGADRSPPSALAVQIQQRGFLAHGRARLTLRDLQPRAASLGVAALGILECQCLIRQARPELSGRRPDDADRHAIRTELQSGFRRIRPRSRSKSSSVGTQQLRLRLLPLLAVTGLRTSAPSRLCAMRFPSFGSRTISRADPIIARPAAVHKIMMWSVKLHSGDNALAPHACRTSCEFTVAAARRMPQFL